MENKYPYSISREKQNFAGNSSSPAYTASGWEVLISSEKNFASA